MIIKDEFKNLIPKLTPEEFAQLEQNILEHGCLDALITWNDILLDGHNRYEICKAHGIEFKTTSIDLDDEDAALLWIEENQLGRRNLTDNQRSAIAFRILERRSAIEKKLRAQKAGEAGGRGRPKEDNSLEDTSASKLSDKIEKPKKERTRKTVAKEAGVSERKIRDISEIAKKAPEMVDKIAQGEKTILEVKKD